MGRRQYGNGVLAAPDARQRIAEENGGSTIELRGARGLGGELGRVVTGEASNRRAIARREVDRVEEHCDAAAKGGVPLQLHRHEVQ